MDLKEKLIRNKLVVGSWLTIGDPAVAEIMAKMGFDWLVVDMEHSAITLQQTQQLVRVIELCGVVPLVRVGENNANIIKRVMDTGAHGVIVPMVNSREDAEKAVAAVKYPPQGTRGVGLARAQSYGIGFDEYKQWNKSKSVVIVQIEHIEAIENLEEILEVAGVDASIIGPYDLSGSLGRPGDFDCSEVKKAFKDYQNICKRLRKSMGLHVISPDVKSLRKTITKGYKFVAYSLDTLFLQAGIGKFKEKD